jgi:hypothetical protein
VSLPRPAIDGVAAAAVYQLLKPSPLLLLLLYTRAPAGLPFRASCCWNGLAVLRAAPFAAGLRIRPPIDQGECQVRMRRHTPIACLQRGSAPACTPLTTPMSRAHNPTSTT